MAIRASKAQSYKELRNSTKRRTGADFLQRVPDTGRTVRFLTEPIEWEKYLEHYDEDHEPRSFPCDDEACEGCESESERVRATSTRYLTNALDVAEDKVIPFVIPKTAANLLLKFYDKYHTIKDRDYEITKEGTGRDTEYGVLPEPPMPLDGVEKLKLIDLHALLEAQLTGSADTDDDDPDDDDESGLEEFVEPPKPKKVMRTVARPRIEDDDDDVPPALRVNTTPKKVIRKVAPPAAKKIIIKKKIIRKP